MTDITAKLDLRLLPFKAPRRVRAVVNVGGRIGKVQLCLIPALSLSQLCDRFRADVFREAGASDPRKQSHAERTIEYAADELGRLLETCRTRKALGEGVAVLVEHLVAMQSLGAQESVDE